MITLQRRHALLLLTAAGLLLVVTLASERPALLLYRFPMSASSDYAWIANDRILQQVSNTEVRLLMIGPEKRAEKLMDDFPRLRGVSASPDGKSLAWQNGIWTYSVAVADLARPVLPRRQENDWRPASNTLWLDNTKYVTLFRGLDGAFASIASRDSDNPVARQAPQMVQDSWWSVDLQIIGTTKDGDIALVRSDVPPTLQGKLRVCSFDLAGSASTIEANVPFGVALEASDQVALAPPGNRLVWVVRRSTKPTWTGRAMARVSGARLAYEEYVLSTTDLTGGSLRVIARFPLFVQNGFCGFVKASPDGRLISLRVGSELCIYPLL